MIRKEFYIRNLIVVLFILFSASLRISAQVDCIQKYSRIKSKPIKKNKDLIEHYDALDSLLNQCKHEDLDWINTVIDKAILLEDNLVSHSLPWSYYLFLYWSDKRENDGFEFLKKIVDYSDKHQFPINGDLLVQLGIHYNSIGDLANELNAYQKALESYKNSNSNNLHYAYGMIGRFYFNAELYEESLNFRLKSYDLCQKIEFPSESVKNFNISNNCMDIGYIYWQLDSLDLAENFYLIGMDAAKNQLNLDLTLTKYGLIIEFFSQIGKVQLGEKYLRECNAFINKMKDQDDFSIKESYLEYHKIVRSNFGISHNFKQYIIHPNKISVEKLENSDKKEFYSFANNYYKYHNNSSKALEFSEKLVNHLENDAKEQLLSVMNVLEEKQNNVLLEKQNSALLRSEQIKINQQNFSIGLISLLLVLLLFFFLTLRRTRQHNINIENQRIEIKNQFNELERITYVMTHDLKEPITTVNSFTNLLVNRHSSSLGNKEKTYLNIIQNTSKTMLKSVDMLHNYLLLGKRSKLITTDLNTLWDLAQQNLKSTIIRNNAIITQDKLPTILCYKDEMLILLQSLLSNAIKYSKPNVNPVINLEFVKDSYYYKFGLTDNGIGIEKSKKENIFDLFTRLQTNENTEGSGIGLSNARKIIEQHKGQIWVDSELNVGSTFWFTIDRGLR